MMPSLSDLIRRYGIISDQITQPELLVILQELAHALRRTTDGSLVEFGCYGGTTSLYIRRLMDKHGASGEFHVYDSFAGLPDKTLHDYSPAGEQFKAGELAVSKKDFIMNFKKAGLRPPRIHKAWFSDLAAADIPDNICFAFLDGDYYESIRTPLQLITPKLASGAIIVIDDYVNVALPGAARAVDDWAEHYGYAVRTEKSLGIIHT